MVQHGDLNGAMISYGEISICIRMYRLGLALALAVRIWTLAGDGGRMRPSHFDMVP